METPENEARAMREAEIRKEKHTNLQGDPVFYEMMDDLLLLVEKYGKARVIAAIKSDYRNTNWIHLFRKES